MSIRSSWILALFFLTLPSIVNAHSRGTSYSNWILTKEGAEVNVRASQLDLSRLQLDPMRTPDYLIRVGDVLGSNIQLWSRSGPCDAGPVTAMASDSGWVDAHWRLRCSNGQAIAVRTNLFLNVAPSHLHFARVESRDGEIREQVLTYSTPYITLDEHPGIPDSFMRYIKLGIEHILSGWDHMAFVLGLILLATNLREVALVVTGFTLSHSLTLAAAVLGWAHVQSDSIEALIGFSIALIAIENLWRRSEYDRWVPRFFTAALLFLMLFGVSRLPWLVLMGLAIFSTCYFGLVARSQTSMRLRVAVAFIFGLVHGFGFAGVMTQMKLPSERLVTGLLGFNTGVELGQLLVIATVWPILRFIGQRPIALRWTSDLGSSVICGLGTFWFLSRALA